MSPLLIMLFAAIGPMLAVFDPFEDDAADEEDQADLAHRNQIDPGAQTGTEEDDAFAALPEDASMFNGLSGADQIIGGDQGDTLVAGEAWQGEHEAAAEAGHAESHRLAAFRGQ